MNSTMSIAIRIAAIFSRFFISTTNLPFFNKIMLIIPYFSFKCKFLFVYTYNAADVGMYVLSGGYTYSSLGVFISFILVISITGISP